MWGKMIKHANWYHYTNNVMNGLVCDCIKIAKHLSSIISHDDVIAWERFHNIGYSERIGWWPLRIYRSPADSSHKWPVMQNLDVFNPVSLNKLLNKQQSYMWFGMTRHSVTWFKYGIFNFLTPGDAYMHHSACTDSHLWFKYRLVAPTAPSHYLD